MTAPRRPKHWLPRRRARSVLVLSGVFVGGGLAAALPATLHVGPFTLAIYFGLAQPLLVLGLAAFVLGTLLGAEEKPRADEETPGDDAAHA